MYSNTSTRTRTVLVLASTLLQLQSPPGPTRARPCLLLRVSTSIYCTSNMLILKALTYGLLSTVHWICHTIYLLVVLLCMTYVICEYEYLLSTVHTYVHSSYVICDIVISDIMHLCTYVLSDTRTCVTSNQSTPL